MKLLSYIQFWKKPEKEDLSKLSPAQLHTKMLAKRAELVQKAELPRLTIEQFLQRKGLLGLENHGNTCYINSAIQCLSHCEELTAYMLKGQWETEVNTVNPIGTRGELLVEYVKLLHDLWSEKSRGVISAGHFKDRLEMENSSVADC